MKTYRTRSGPFAQRPHFDANEIEQICLSELRKVDLFPQNPEPIRIDRFIEKRFRVVPRYEPLPDGVLGYTRFGPSGVEAIIVSTVFDGDGSQVAERRLRTTLAHEAGHGLLHAHLFALDDQPSDLFDADSRDGPKILCRDVHGEKSPGGRYDGRWWEFQANRAIAGLLMPRALVVGALAPYLQETTTLRGKELDSSRRETAVRTLSDLFEVNPVVARLRLVELYPENESGQLSL